ncbi:MAG: HD domain-containing protein [Bacilli bacterium]|nr:HD domain-containing protein [Bacilli bacterium]
MDKEIKFFEDYVNKFDKSIDKVMYKYKHTYRVVGFAKEIAKSLDLDEKEYNRAVVCALFHDLGRFEQVTNYNTYIDRISFDHGDRGYEILKENNYNDEIVQKAVKYHNKKDVPVFDELTNMHCNIVRDADKIDIIIETSNSVKNPNVRIDEHVINNFKNHELVANEAGDTDFLYVIREIAFFFDINYKRSMEILLEHDLLNKKLNLIRSDINKDQVDLIEKELKKYIKERFDIEC